MKQLYSFNKSGYKSIVDHYLQSFNNAILIERTSFAQWMDEIIYIKKNLQSSSKPEDLLYLKILCIKSGHQKRMIWAHVVMAIRKLDEHNLFDFSVQYRNFRELYDKVSDAVIDVPFARGLLTRYDISLHIAILLDNPIYPEHIYLANHTRESARILNVYEYPYVEKNQFPIEFQTLSCMQLEDVLCVYSSLFLGKTNDIQKITEDSCKYKIKSKVKMMELYKDAESDLKIND